MTLKDEVDKPTRKLEIEVWLGLTPLRAQIDPTGADGVPGIISLKVSKSIDNPVPVASVTVNRIPNWIQLGHQMIVVLGYNGQGAMVFKGTVQDRAHGDLDGQINAVGGLFSMFRTVQIPAQDFSGGAVTTKLAIEQVLDYAMGDSYTTIGLDTTTFTIGTATGGNPKLERQTSARMLQAIADLERWRIWENNNGEFVFKDIHAPGEFAFRTYSTVTAANAIVRQRAREDPTAVRTRLTVRGDTLTTGSSPDETTTTIEETAEVINAAASIPGLAPLPATSFIDAEYSNNLVDTAAKAQSLATAILNEFAFVPQQIQLSVPGDPELDIGQTITVDYPEKNIVAKFYIHGVQHIVDPGYTTILDLRGGENASVQIGIIPDVSFDARIDREVFNDAVHVFATFDASNSHAADGGALTYDWGDNQAAITSPDIEGETAEIITVALDPDDLSGDWTVTLIVTDSNGLTNTVTQTIDVTPSGAAVAIPATFAAIDNQQSASPDGGANFYDRADADVVSVTARPPDGVNFGIACFGQADGTIMKTTDFCQTALTEVKPTAGGNPKIWDMQWDYRDLNRVWAVDEDMRVYLSTNGGDGFSLYEDLKTLFSLAAGATLRHIGLPRGGGIWVYGGDGAGNPFIAFDPVVLGHSWVNLTLGGDIDTDGPAASNDYRIVDAVDLGAGLTIVLENADAGDSGARPIYFNVNSLDSAGWQRATGLSAGFTNARFVVPDSIPLYFHVGKDDRSVWNTTDGVAYTEDTLVFPLNVVPHHAIYLPSFIHGLLTANVYLIACEDTSAQASGIYKSADALLTVQAHRPVAGFSTWPTSAIGRQVTVGAPGANEERIMGAYLMGGPTSRGVSWRASTVDFIDEDLTGVDVGMNFFRIRALSDQLWFISWFDFATDLDTGDASRTKDGGVTWTDDIAKPAAGRLWQDFCRTSDGRIWGLTVEDAGSFDHVEVWFSDDDGDTWTESYDSTGPVGQRMWTLYSHPLDANRVGVLGFDSATRRDPQVFFTINAMDGASATWNVNTEGSNIFANGTLARELGVMQLTSNRLVITQLDTAGTDWSIFTSDDNGANWVKRQVIGTTFASERLFGPYGEPGGSRLYVAFDDRTASPFEFQIWESRDSGNTWADIGNNAPRRTPTSLMRGGMAYDPIGKALYVYADAGTTTNKHYFQKLFPISASGIWTDVSDQFVPVSGRTALTIPIGSHAMAVIPRP